MLPRNINLLAEEKIMKTHGALITLLTLVVIVAASFPWTESGNLVPQAQARETTHTSKIIADTLASHKLTCLSRDGVIKTVLLDGKWIEVREVELINRTLVIRTDMGNISLAAVINN
jgi:hypothetical protein